MLSEHERHELRGIEEMLLADPRFAGHVRRARARRPAGRFGPDRLLLAGGLLITALGVLFGLGGPFAEGLCLAGAGLLWTRCVRRPRHAGRTRESRPGVPEG